jgi:hypothetical protein
MNLTQYTVTTWVERESEAEVRKDFDAWFPEGFIYDVTPMEDEPPPPSDPT